MLKTILDIMDNLVKSLSSSIKPIEYSTQVDKIQHKLEEYFRLENLKPGDPIPKETELAEAMGVSRTAIREALSRFKLLGIISSRKNRGMIITKPDLLGSMGRVLDSKLLDGQTMKEIFEFRLVIEIGIGDILFLRKTSANLKELEEIVNKEEQTENQIERTNYDVRFHSTLYKISGNDTILRFQNLLLPVFDYVNNSLHIRRQLENEDYVSHRVLLNVLKKGTPEEFRNKMRAHLMQYFEKI
ncbi:MAG TPA: FCD domain-containing protein [Flavitalea sp.]|nr:FCD domain-containing protein [Flavitalea sp.]